MRLKVIGVVVSILLLAVVATTAAAHGAGNSPGHLGERGWNCFNVPDLGVHCMPPGASASSASMAVKVFDTDDPGDEHASFLGTEILIRVDLYAGQPCPQSGLEEYDGLDLFPPEGIDYYACHHYSAHD